MSSITWSKCALREQRCHGGGGVAYTGGMEVVIALTHVTEPVRLNVEKSASEVDDLVTRALSESSVLRLSDDNGRQLVVPSDKIAYALIGDAKPRKVGFAL